MLPPKPDFGLVGLYYLLLWTYNPVGVFLTVPKHKSFLLEKETNP